MGLLKLIVVCLAISTARGSISILRELYDVGPDCSECLSQHAVANITEELQHKLGCEESDCGVSTEFVIILLLKINAAICMTHFHW